MEIFTGLEGLTTVIFEFLIEPAFDKKRTFIKRLPFLLLFILLGILIVGGGVWLSLILLKDKNLLIGIPLLIVSIILFIAFIIPFFKNETKVTKNK